MKTSFYLIVSVLSATFFASCIKEPPCPLNEQKVEFVLDSAHVSLADYISLEPGDEVVIYEAGCVPTKGTGTLSFDRENAVQQKYRFDGESFFPANEPCCSETDNATYYYFPNGTEHAMLVLKLQR